MDLDHDLTNGRDELPKEENQSRLSRVMLLGNVTLRLAERRFDDEIYLDSSGL